MISLASSVRSMAALFTRVPSPVNRSLVIDPVDGRGYIWQASVALPEGYSAFPCKVIEFPTLRQAYTYSCGSCAASTIMQFYGTDVREKDVMNKMGVSPKGTGLDHMINYFKNQGFKVDSGPFTVDKVKNFIDRCIPVIMILQAWPDTRKKGWENGHSNGHFVVAVGYTDRHIIFSDPSSVYDTYLSYEDVEKRWHDTDLDGTVLNHYAVVPYGKRPVYQEDRAIPME